MPVLEKNLRILQQQYSALLQEIYIESDDQPSDIKIENTSAGEPTLSINGIYVHSPRDPLREGQRLAQSIAGGEGPVVILGFGLGYAAQESAAQIPAQIAAKTRRPVIIVERYKSLLLKAFETRDLSDLLASKNVIFVAGGSVANAGDGILNALEIAAEILQSANDADSKAPSVIRNKTLFDLDKEWYGAVEEKLYTWAMKDRVNSATHKRFGQRWVRNLSRNMSAIRDLPGISRMEDLAHIRRGDAESAVPVFLAAAGPSLDRVQPLLRDIYDRCIIVTVDTGLRFFVQNGIQPDFVLTVDPQFWNSRHLDRLTICQNVCEKTALIAESAVFPPVLNLPFKRKFLCGSLFPLGTFIENRVDQKGRLGAGGSVATTAWDFARSLGAQYIWIAGLDLAYPELKTHFRGARFEERANSESCRFSPAETWIASALRDGIPLKARSCNGGEVLTDRRLSLYAAWFENQFSQHKNVKNFALFQEGLAITGLHAGSAEQLIAHPNRRAEIDALLQERYAQIDKEFCGAEEMQKRSGRYDNAVSLLTRALGSIKKAAEEGAEIVRRALEKADVGGVNVSQQDKVVKELDKVTRQIAESEVKEIAGFLSSFDESKSAAAGKTGDPFNSYLQSSLKLFTSLTEAAGFYLGRLNMP